MRLLSSVTVGVHSTAFSKKPHVLSRGHVNLPRAQGGGSRGPGGAGRGAGEADVSPCADPGAGDRTAASRRLVLLLWLLPPLLPTLPASVTTSCDPSFSLFPAA